MKKLIIAALLLAVLMVSGCSKSDLIGQFTGPVDPDDETIIEVVIPSGSTTEAISDILLNEELIQSKLAFKELAKDLGADTAFKAGTYHLDRTMDAETIIGIISGGEVYRETVKFTIPEGFENRQIIDRLVSEGLVEEEALLSALDSTVYDYAFLEQVDRSMHLEGYLYPDTYEIEVGASAEEIVDVMLRQFDRIFKPEYYERLEALDMDLNELITLASIIEREAKLDEERALISSVFHNRLNIDMRLQSCATIQYALGERKEVLSYADLEIESPYNTYTYYGLPPAPIASPGEASIIAALYPEETDYLFFVTKETGDGSHYFNETLDGHNQDKNRSE